MRVLERIELAKQGITEPERDAFHQWAADRKLL